MLDATEPSAWGAQGASTALLPRCNGTVLNPATSMHRHISVHTGATSTYNVSVWTCKLVISCQPLKTEHRWDSTKATKTMFNKGTAPILFRYTLGQIQLQARTVERRPLAFWELHMIFMKMHLHRAQLVQCKVGALQ